jgi:group I intron endonuclease
MQTVGAYVLTYARTGKFYEGSSGQLTKRLARHLRELRQGVHHCQPLQQLWNKDGRLIETIFETDTREQAYELEQDLITRFQTSDQLLNIGLKVIGGDNLTRHPQREQIRAKIKEAVVEKMYSLTALEKKLLFGLPGSRNGMWGKTHSPQTRQLISQAHKGKRYALGHKHTDEFRKQVSERAKLRTGTRNAFYGKKHSDETKKKLSQAALDRQTLPSNSRPVIVNGIEYESLTQASRQLNISPALMVYRLKSSKTKYAGYHYKGEGSTTTA